MRASILPAFGLLLACAATDGGSSTSTQPAGEVPEPSAQPAARPNILFVFSDDHATAAISAYGSRVNRTPNIDRLAAEGVVFDNVFCGNAICAPSRATVLTGKHSAANGVADNGDVFDGAQPHLASILQDAGYTTALIGKWHLKSDPTGFDHWEVLPGQGSYYEPDFLTSVGKLRRHGYVTDVTTDLAIEWLEGQRDADEPFLLMCQHKAPHRPWLPGPNQLGMYADAEVPEPPTLFDDYATRSSAAAAQEMEIDRHMYLFYDLCVPPADASVELHGPDRWTASSLARLTGEQRAALDATFAAENAAFRAAELEGRDLVRWKYQRYMKNYLRCVAGVDDSIGRLLDWLDDAGLADDTIVVYSSDQGFYLGEHGWYDKRWMYEPSLRMPLVVRWPGVARAGTRSALPAQNTDFAPTLLDAAGVAAPPDMHGASLVPALRGETPADWREDVYYEYSEVGIHAVEPHRGVRDARYKLIEFPGLAEWELYDLETDPEELRNRYDDPELAEVRARLSTRLRELAALYGGEAVPE